MYKVIKASSLSSVVPVERNRHVYAAVDYGNGPQIDENAIIDYFNRICNHLNWAREDRGYEKTRFTISNIRYVSELASNTEVSYKGIITDSDGNSVEAYVGFIVDDTYFDESWMPYGDMFDDTDMIAQTVWDYIDAAGLPQETLD